MQVRQVSVAKSCPNLTVALSMTLSTALSVQSAVLDSEPKPAGSLRNGCREGNACPKVKLASPQNDFPLQISRGRGGGGGDVSPAAPRDLCRVCTASQLLSKQCRPSIHSRSRAIRSIFNQWFHYKLIVKYAPARRRWRVQ